MVFRQFMAGILSIGRKTQTINQLIINLMVLHLDISFIIQIKF